MNTKPHIIFLFLLFFGTLSAQNADCFNALPVCQMIQSVAPTQGAGNFPNELPANSCIAAENNSVWFLITPQSSGTLSFVISPNNPNENLNWSLFNLSNASCANIPNNPSLQVACNASADLNGVFADAFGQTGAHTTQPWYGGIFAFYPSFIGDISVQAGSTYALYVTTTAAVGQGFSIDFSNSTAVLFNNISPNLESATVSFCGVNTVEAHFSKPILCSSVTPSDFLLQLPNGSNAVPVSVSSANCAAAANGSATVYTLTFATPFFLNNYNLQLVGTVSDFCGNLLNNQQKAVSVPTPAVQAGNTMNICAGQSINQIVGMTGFYPNQTFQWTAIPAAYLSALSNTNASAATLNIAQMPADTVLFILTTTTSTGCTAADTLFINGYDCCANFAANITNTTQVGCFGTSTGAATVTASGSLAPTYTYLWNTSPQKFTASVSGLSANQTYTVTVTDGNQCQATANVTLSQPNTPLSIATNGTNVACFGGSNGSVNLTVNGGTMPYNYTWNNGTTTEDLSNIPAGNYAVTVADANNCTITIQRNISQPPTALNVNTTATGTVCTLSDGTISLQISGGSSPYTRTWSHGLGSALQLSGLISGNYTVTVTDNLGCTVVKTQNVPSNSTLTAIATPTNASCALVNDGNVQLSVSGGQAPFSFLWNNGSTTQSINSLFPNNYNVTITDANGCLFTTSAVVGANTTFQISTTSTAATCFGANNGALQTQITGGTSPYAFQWSNGTSNATATNLIAGNYTVTVTDANGCPQVTTATVSQPSAINILLSKNNISCFNGNNGSVQATATGGTAPYTFLWSNGGTNSTINNLIIGNYTVTVTDANGCTATQTATLTQPTVLNVLLSQNNVSCINGNNGSIQATATGGTSPYTFQWSNGGTTAQIGGLSATNYTVTVTDAKGCTSSQSATLTQPNAVTISFLKNNISCFNANNGSIQTTVGGGTAPYTYLWSNGSTAQNLNNLNVGNYTLTVTDANGCVQTQGTTVTQPTAINILLSQNNISCSNGNNGSVQATVTGGQIPYTFAWSNGATTSNISNLTSGVYTVTITDANGCTASQSATLTQPTVLNVSLSQNNISCFNGNDGNIQTTVTGGTSPYSFQWSNGTSSANANNLAVGSYSVTITDANGCTTSQTVALTQPTVLGLTLTIIPPACGQSGGITANVTGGSLPYSFQWSSNANAGNASSVSNLLGGVYDLTVTDAAGCIAVANSVTFTGSTSLAVLASVVQPHCQNNGVINLSPISGVAPFNYSWSSNANVGNIGTATGLGGGTYSVTVTDAAGCDTSFIFSLNAPTILAGNATVLNTTCRQNNGSILYNVTSGTPPYNYFWSNTMNNTNSQQNLPAGSYSLLVSDGGGCALTENFMIAPSDSLLVVAQIEQPTCTEAGSISLTAVGGVAPYSYNWSANANTGDVPLANGLSGGVYSVVVFDSGNCQATADFELTDAAPFEVALVSLTNNDCFNGNDGSILINAVNATNPINYSWSNGQTSAQASNLAAGFYSVTATDAVTECETTANFEIEQPQPFFVVLPPNFTVTTGAIVAIAVQNPLPDVIYTWRGSDGSTATGDNISVQINATTTYTVFASQNGCPPITTSITVSANDLEAIKIPTAFSPNDDGKNDIFRIVSAIPLQVLTFQIFSRWGEIIYDDTAGQWDGSHRGKVSPNGAYVYLIEVVTPSGEQHIFKGELILVR